MLDIKALRFNYQWRLVSRGRWLLERCFKSHEDSPTFPFSAEEERGQEESKEEMGAEDVPTEAEVTADEKVEK